MQSHNSLSNKTDLYSALDKIKFSSIHFLQFIAATFQLSIRYINYSTVTFFIVPIKNFYSLNNLEEKLSLSMFYLGSLIGFISVSYIIKYTTRKTHCILHSLIMTALLLIQAFSVTPGVFIILRFFIGLETSILAPVPINTLMENLPTNSRAHANMIINVCAQFIHGLLMIIVLIIMPNYEITQLKWLFLTIVFLSFFNTIFFILWHDSVLSMISNNYEFKGIAQIDEMISEKQQDELNKIQKYWIIRDVKVKNKNSVDNEVSLKLLFTHNYLKTTILLSIVYFCLGFLIGFPAIYALIGQKWGFKASNVILSFVVNKIIVIAFVFLSSYLLDNQNIGRKKTIIFFAFFAIGPLLVMYFFSALLLVLGPMYLGLFMIIYVCISLYTVEIFPTKLRDQAVGFFWSMYAFGTILYSFILLSALNVSDFLPFVLLSIASGIIAICIIFVPHETVGKELD